MSPDIINALQQSLTLTLDEQVDFLALDNSYAWYTDKYYAIIDEYYTELTILDGTYTRYDRGQIDKAARLAPDSLHFPFAPDVWVYFNPKQLASNTGSPYTPTPTTQSDLVNSAISVMSNIKSNYSEQWRTDASSIPSPIVTDPGPPPIFGPDYRQEVADAKVSVNAAVQSVETNLYESLTAVNHNTTTDNVEIVALGLERDSIQSCIDAIDLWQSFPSDSPGDPDNSRFGDLQLDTLIAAFNLRLADIPPRITQIKSYLGSLTQNGDDFSGHGYWWIYFLWLCQRVSKGKGALSKYYSAQLSIDYFNFAIKTEQNLAVEQTKDLNSTKILVDVLPVDTMIEVLDVTGFTVLDIIKIADNESIVNTRTIIDITGLKVTLDSAVGLTLTTNEVARMFVEI